MQCNVIWHQILKLGFDFHFQAHVDHDVKLEFIFLFKVNDVDKKKFGTRLTSQTNASHFGSHIKGPYVL